jgi:hypothetical protein
MRRRKRDRDAAPKSMGADCRSLISHRLPSLEPEAVSTRPPRSISRSCAACQAIPTIWPYPPLCWAWPRR